MAIFGFKKRKDEKLVEQAQVTKSIQPMVKKTSTNKAMAVKALKIPTQKTRDKVMSVPALKSESASNAASIIIRPRITEKSGLLSQGGVYTFEVMRNANKQSISRAITALYKVTPVKIAVINTVMKNVFIKGRRGTVAGIRKAVVTVKKGEKIDFV